MIFVADILGDPNAIRSPTFDPRNYVVLDIKLGEPKSSLVDWEFSEINSFGWHFLNGGIRVRVVDDVVSEIALPQNFLPRIGIQTVANLFAAFGEPNGTEEISYRGRVTRRAYIWQRGFLIWCDAIEDTPDYLVLFDPSKPAPTHAPDDV